MSERVIVGGGEVRKYLLILLGLLLLLALLLFAYYIINRPPQLTTAEKEAGQSDFRFQFAIYGFEGDLLNRPSFACVGPDGRIYVADTMKNRVVVFDSEGNYVGMIKGEENGPYKLKWPVSVGVSDDGRIYVLSKQDKKLIVFNRDYKPVRVIEFDNVIPSALLVKGDRIYVGTDKAILIGTLDGRLLKQLGRFGKKEGQFDLIGGLAVSDDGKTIYVADSLNYRIQAIDAETGKAKWVYGKPLPPETAIQYQGKDRKFGLPASITLDERGRLYVVDGLSSEILIFDARDGTLIKKAVDIGHKEGKVYYPDGIHYGKGGIIAVADKFNDRVQIFKVPTPGIAGAIPSWTPWLALLPVLLLILWLLFAPKVKFVADEAFVLNVLESDYRKDIERSLKKLFVLPEVAEKYSEQFEKLKFQALEFDSDLADEIRDNYQIDDTYAAILAGTKKLRGRRTLLLESENVRKIAEENFDVATMNYEELIKSMYGRGKDEQAA